MKQTAVEWFYQRILAEDIKVVFEQAKEMEKEQIIDAFEYAWYEWAEMTPNVAEQYYNETFKSE
jgi:NACalpha-BTF3-like transcription factor